MKKILLIIITIILILSVNVLAVVINIGMPAIDRGSTASTYTWVNVGNPANASGTITFVEIWANTALTNCEVATFYVVSGNNLSTRDTQFIGSVPSGAAYGFEVDLDVEAGDYIGAYYTGGALERGTTDYPGCWMKTGDNIPCTNALFTFRADEAISLCGTGIIEEEAINTLFFGTNF